MTKEQLVFLIKNLHPEDKSGGIEAVVHDVNGGTFVTDSIRLDMDGGRLIISQKNSPSYNSNKLNWEQELNFVKEEVC
jgi:ABC-type hemin transport system ATPase subunit